MANNFGIKVKKQLKTKNQPKNGAVKGKPKDPTTESLIITNGDVSSHRIVESSQSKNYKSTLSRQSVDSQSLIKITEILYSTQAEYVPLINVPQDKPNLNLKREINTSSECQDALNNQHSRNES